MAYPPVLIGENKSAAGTTSLGITTSVGVPPGSIIAVYMGWGTQNGGTPNTTGTTDNSGLGNSYFATTANSVTNGNSRWYYCLAEFGLPSGDIITTTWSGSPSGNVMIACYIPGINFSNALDKSVIGGANSTTYSLSSGTLSQANEVLLQGCTDPDGSATTNTMSAPWTSLLSSYQSSGGAGLNLVAAVGYDLVTSTSAVTGATTTNSAGDLTASVLSWRMLAQPTVQPSQAIQTASCW